MKDLKIALKKNIYLKNARAIKEICYRDDCDVSTGRAKWEHEAGIVWSREQNAKRQDMIKEFNRFCNKYTLNAIVKEIEATRK